MRARGLLSFASLTAAALVAACGRPGEFSASSSGGTGSSGDASSGSSTSTSDTTSTDDTTTKGPDTSTV